MVGKAPRVGLHGHEEAVRLQGPGEEQGQQRSGRGPALDALSRRGEGAVGPGVPEAHLGFLGDDLRPGPAVQGSGEKGPDGRQGLRFPGEERLGKAQGFQVHHRTAFCSRL